MAAAAAAVKFVSERHLTSIVIPRDDGRMEELRKIREPILINEFLLK